MDKKTLRLNLILCAILHGLNHYLLIFYKPMYPLMAGFFGLSTVADITTRLTIAYVGYGIANFITGILARRINLKYILFGGMLLMSLSTMAMALVPSGSYGLFVFLAFLMGLGGGTYHPAANTLMTSLHEEKHGHAIGILSIGSAIGFALAPLAGTFLGGTKPGAGIIGFQNLFILSGIIGFVYAWIFFFMMRGVAVMKAPAPAPSGQRSGFSAGTLGLIIVFLVIPSTIREIMAWGHYEITSYWVENGFSQGIGVGIIQVMAYLPGLVVQPLAGKLCDRLGSVRVVMGTFALTSIGYLLLVPASPVTAWLGLVLYGTGLSAATVANETFMASVATSRTRGIVYGIVLSLALGAGGYLSGCSGLIVDFFGKTSDTGYRVWFGGIALVNLAGILCYPVIERLKRRAKNGELYYH
jgi:MFS family permease